MEIDQKQEYNIDKLVNNGIKVKFMFFSFFKEVSKSWGCTKKYLRISGNICPLTYLGGGGAISSGDPIRDK